MKSKTNSDDSKSDDLTPLAKRHCVPCRGDCPPLTADETANLLAELSGWLVIDGHHLSKRFAFDDFASALAFVNRIGAVAEKEDHHPDLRLSWGRVEVEISTHAIDGLTENDFILAARIDTQR